MSDITPWGGPTSRVSGALARRTNRELQQLAAQTQIDVAEELSAGFVTSVRMTVAVSLIEEAKRHAQATPEAAGMLQTILSDHERGARLRAARGW